MTGKGFLPNFTPWIVSAFDDLMGLDDTLAAALGLNVPLFFVQIATAAVLGNSSNDAIGRFAGAKWLRPGPKLDETRRAFEKWGGWAVTLSRFLPFLRTFLPFVAGVSRMRWRSFTVFNALGGCSGPPCSCRPGSSLATCRWCKKILV